MSRLALDLSGTPCLLDFQGFHCPLGVTAAGLDFTLAPWTYRRHMDTLRASTRAAASPRPARPRSSSSIASVKMPTLTAVEFLFISTGPVPRRPR